MAAIRELDLSAYHSHSIADRINDAVPGLKTSTAFFTFLRANLVLPPSAMASNVSTPLLEPSVSQTLPPPSPSPLAQPPQTDLDGIPPLSLDVLASRDDKVDAFKLVADSIAQQRQKASLNLVFHPLLLAALIGALSWAGHYGWVTRYKDLGTTLLLVSGIIMTYLMGIRYLSSPYIRVAEALRWDWLVADDGEEDTIIGSRFGDEMIGALVLRLEPNPSLAGKKKNRALSLKGGKGVIRAWTTKLRYRKRGVGNDLLHEAVRVTREKCGKDAEVGFAQEHANSTMVLPNFFNGPFRKQEMQAARTLEKVLGEWEGNRRKR
ncbi:putative acetyltransferase protein [Phaeoacremonium minimum UCRPA7]|uniref:Putative acetyltransferase protein n=1 Tax=Phaeoacremonium minimum (strain UCR-PA7) TaxID=1286976 RepID=R8BPZ2_PHAM7|nr:putative acetyltransferase protein [Phaeoacremonium minimum UCRPA7]EOO01416.1 putative acetyltransferase protein [Phaeoacremonium minimum UCRPA7]